MLTNLKKMFVVTSFKVKLKMDELRKEFNLIDNGQEECKLVRYLLGEVSEHYEAMVEYFKIGNSFY